MWWATDPPLSPMPCGMGADCLGMVIFDRVTSSRHRAGAHVLRLALVTSTLVLGQIVTPEEFTGPTIDRLKQRVARGNRADIDDFWKDLHQSNAPLVEPLA